MVETALIIAAGKGTRLKSVSGDLPKPLLRVAGVPLIKRVILTAHRAGIARFVVVTGYAADQFHATLDGDPQVAGLIEWVHNAQWEAPNGLSVLAARDHLPGSFLLSMADHLFDMQNLRLLQYAPRENDECVLCIDRKVETVYDLDDATKVQVNGSHLLDIGKDLASYNAIDTGLFLCSPALFEALDQTCGQGHAALSDGVRVLARQGRMRVCDIGDGFWQDIDTPAMLDHAERLLLQAVRKPTDGVIARHLNRPISTRVSRWMVRTSISPNQITMGTFLIGLLAAPFVSAGTYWSVFWAALCLQVSSILDGCDGEVAKLTFRESKYGAWLDTVTDNLTHLVFFIGVILGYSRQANDPRILLLGGGSMAIILLALVMMYYYLLKTGGSGSLLRYNTAFERHAVRQKRGMITRCLNGLRFMIKRDFFSMVFLSCAVLGRLDWMFWIIALGGLTMAVGVFASIGHLLHQARAAQQGKASA
ncbi:MAG: NTP transferase domain-containing protein [Candidatus Latescibacteria bacterium]|nr:NTP transferase domain-containing protein [Candidatus Latescibacterota bacterium]